MAISGTLLIFGATLLLGIFGTFSQVPSVQVIDQQQHTLVNDLLSLHATHIYTDYWTCDLVAFLSHERIVCEVLDNNLQAGVNRYGPYTKIVEADPHAYYVFPIGSPQSAAFLQQELVEKAHYHLIMKDHYDIYLPTSTS